jgi:N-acetylmuramoyl-L-alanine amidase
MSTASVNGHVVGLPLRPGAQGEAVRDLQRRLKAAGHSPDDIDGDYGDTTAEAVRSFQAKRGLRVDGICGPQTWSALVEAGFALGDRLLYLRRPMLRGDDVAELQRRLGALGFDAGRVDGMFGDDTLAALIDFQHNTGLTTDGVCGPATLAGLDRLGRRPGRDTGTVVAQVREQETLRAAPRTLAGRRLAVGEHGGLGALLAIVTRTIADAGAIVLALDDPDGSVQARQANSFSADVYIGLALADHCRASYYRREDFESGGGRHLAAMLATTLPLVLGGPACAPTGMALPVLRETRMPAVVCELGPATTVVERGADVARAVRQALTLWAQSPP